MRIFPILTGLFTFTIALASSIPSAQASPTRANRWTDKTTPTCYVKLGNSQQRLDHLCGVNDPKTNRKRNPYELDSDGLPFVMKENFRALKEAQQKIQAANRKLEDEMPFSPEAKQMMTEQRAIMNQLMSARPGTNTQALQKRYQEIQVALRKDPSVKKSYDMMNRLYQQR